MKGMYNMLDDILNEYFVVEIDSKKYKLEFNHLAYATLEKETGKSIYFFYDELTSCKNLMYTDLLCLMKAGMLKLYSENEIDIVIEFLRENIHQIQNIKNNLLMAFVKPLLAPSVIVNIKKKVQPKMKTKKLKI